MEREAREKKLDAIAHYLLCQEKTSLVTEERGKWLIEEYRKLLPESRTGQACHYLMRQYKAMPPFLEEGRLEVENNLVENSIRRDRQ